MNTTDAKREIWTHRIGGAYPAVLTVYEDGEIVVDGYIGHKLIAQLLAIEVARLNGQLARVQKRLEDAI